MSMDDKALIRIERDIAQMRVNQVAIMTALSILVPAATQTWLEERADEELARIKEELLIDDAEEAPDAA